jgi:hypothetical protein
MADKKISALTAASTPLAGTEVLPIVQSGATVKVSADNLWAGRVVTSDGFRNQRPGVPTQYIEQVAAGGGVFLNIVNNANSAKMSYQVVRTTTAGTTTPLELDSNDQFKVLLGNVVMGTATRGINFTANTPAAGMTSQLLNWYEEGTWTPSLGVNGFSGAPATTATSGTYTRIGRQVTVHMKLTFGSSTYPSANSVVTGLPFTPAVPEGVGAYTGSNPGSGVQGGVVQVNTSGQVAWWPSTGTTTSTLWFATVTYFV